jgi:hypothetical protein
VDYEDGVEIIGTGTPGATGTITVGGVSHDVTVDGRGGRGNLDQSLRWIA